jgi:cytidylate kinase
MIIAIDGPAASGKGTIARRLAEAFGLPHLDTGLLYRATARAVLDGGGDINDLAAAVSAARGLGLTDFDEGKLRGKDMGEAASIVASMPAVRAALVDAQRAFAGRHSGAVLDGRDIGTVICPRADAKIFVVADAEVRAQRRALELRKRGDAADYAAVLADIRRRDERDSARSTAPLKRAEDAAVLDTTKLDIEAAVSAAVAIVMDKMPAAPLNRQAGQG